jgi:hypothetical protein
MLHQRAIDERLLHQACPFGTKLQLMGPLSQFHHEKQILEI